MQLPLTGGPGKDSNEGAGELVEGGVGGYNDTRVHLRAVCPVLPRFALFCPPKCFPVFSGISFYIVIAHPHRFPAYCVHVCAYRTIRYTNAYAYSTPVHPLLPATCHISTHFVYCLAQYVQ